MSAATGGPSLAAQVATTASVGEVSGATVLTLMDSSSVSGPIRQLAATIRPLRAKGVRMHCVLFQRDGAAAIESPAFLEDAGATVTVVHDTGRFDRSLPTKVLHVIRDSGAQIIESHGYRPSVILAALRLTRRLPIPWIGFFHGRTAESLLIRLYDKLDHIALRAADEVLVMSERQRREKASYGTRVRVLHNASLPVPASRTDDALPVPSTISSAPAPRIAVIGRLSPEKGVDVLLPAWSQLVANGAAGTLLIIGDGQERATLERSAAPLVRAGRVVFVGHLPETRDVYPHLNLLVIPSRTEGLPNVFTEALQQAVPIVSTRVGAIPDLVGDTLVARLCDTDDPTGLAAQIHDALSHGVSASQEHARFHLLSVLSLDYRVESLARIYHDLLAAVTPA
jgi:glycosyltransferase involved in cell wall biosynthesis